MLFSSCSYLSFLAGGMVEAPESVKSDPKSALEEKSEHKKTPARDFFLPEIIELSPHEKLLFDFPEDAEVKSADESVASILSDGIRAGEQGETTLRVTLDGVMKEAVVSVVTFDEAEEQAAAELPKGKYFLVVNKTRNYVVVYDLADKEREKPLKTMICSTGKATPDKTYKIGSRKAWNRLYGNVWGKYATQITGDILFHSVPYQQKDSSTLIGSYYNQLGTAASMGCVRLRVCDSKWIYDCCESGTTVTFVKEDVDPPIPCEKPILLPDELTWDPTDVDEGNPWYEKEPTIEAENITVALGAEFDPADYIKVLDLAGNDVTADAVYDGRVNTSFTGRYLLRVTYSGAVGKGVSKIVAVTATEGE